MRLAMIVIGWGTELLVGLAYRLGYKAGTVLGNWWAKRPRS